MSENDPEVINEKDGSPDELIKSECHQADTDDVVDGIGTCIAAVPLHLESVEDDSKKINLDVKSNEDILKTDKPLECSESAAPGTVTTSSTSFPEMSARRKSSCEEPMDIDSSDEEELHGSFVCSANTAIETALNETKSSILEEKHDSNNLCGDTVKKDDGFQAGSSEIAQSEIVVLEGVGATTLATEEISDMTAVSLPMASSLLAAKTDEQKDAASNFFDTILEKGSDVAINEDVSFVPDEPEMQKETSEEVCSASVRDQESDMKMNSEKETLPVEVEHPKHLEIKVKTLTRHDIEQSEIERQLANQHSVKCLNSSSFESDVSQISSEGCNKGDFVSVSDVIPMDEEEDDNCDEEDTEDIEHSNFKNLDKITEISDKVEERPAKLARFDKGEEDLKDMTLSSLILKTLNPSEDSNSEQSDLGKGDLLQEFESDAQGEETQMGFSVKKVPSLSESFGDVSSFKNLKSFLSAPTDNDFCQNETISPSFESIHFSTVSECPSSIDLANNDEPAQVSNYIETPLDSLSSDTKSPYQDEEEYITETNSLASRLPDEYQSITDRDEPMDIDSPEDSKDYVTCKGMAKDFGDDTKVGPSFHLQHDLLSPADNKKIAPKKSKKSSRKNMDRPRGEGGRFLKGSICMPEKPDAAILDEETRMEAGTPLRPLLLDEDSQSSISASSKKEVRRFRCEVIVPESTEIFTVDKVVEYVWPLDGNGEHYFVQEQISQYLGIMSFKRRYPDLRRRPIDMQEKDYLKEKGFVSEIACDLGLTAVRSEDVMDVMFNDFPRQFEELQKVLSERKEMELKEQGKVDYQMADLDKSKIQEYARKAAINAAKWNALLNRERKEERRYSFDLQTFTLQKPSGMMKTVPAKYTKMGHYPVSVLPGQYTDSYEVYSSDSLKSLPLNSVLSEPVNQDLLGSDGESSESEEEQIFDIIEAEVSQKNASSRNMIGLKCKVCTGGHNSNKNGKPEPLITCASCKLSSHPSCVDLLPAIVSKIESYAWQCMECKYCFQCNNTDDEDKMIFCDMCDRGFHIYCVGLRRVPQGRWHCKECAVCSSCGSRTPAGNEIIKNAEWQHEFKKERDNKTLKYATTLCVPCDKYWKRRQFCYVCLKIYRSIPEDGMVRCFSCPKYIHKEGCSKVLQNERYCNICYKARSKTAYNHSRIIAAAKKKMAAGF